MEGLDPHSQVLNLLPPNTSAAQEAALYYSLLVVEGARYKNLPFTSAGLTQKGQIHKNMEAPDEFSLSFGARASYVGLLTCLSAPSWYSAAVF